MFLRGGGVAASSLVSGVQYLLGDKNSRFLKSMLKIFKLVLFRAPRRAIEVDANFPDMKQWDRRYRERISSGTFYFLILLTTKINFNNSARVTRKGCASRRALLTNSIFKLLITYILCLFAGHKMYGPQLQLRMLRTRKKASPILRNLQAWLGSSR